MSNNKQSSIELFIEQLEEKGGAWENVSIRRVQISIDVSEYMELKQQAKAMHKEEREQLSGAWAKLRDQTRESAMRIGFAKGFECALECGDDYYNELDITDLDEDEFTRNYIDDEFEKTYKKSEQ